MRVFKGSCVVDRAWIENRDVGERAGTKYAAVAQTQSLRRQAAKFPDRLFQRQQMLVAHIAAENARKTAVGARMRLRFA